MRNAEKLAQLGHTQFVKDIQLFWHSLFHAKRAAGVRAKLERSRQEAAEAELELQLEDASAALQLPQHHPMVIAAVIFHAKLNAARKAQEEDHTPNYPSVFGGFDW